MPCGNEFIGRKALAVNVSDIAAMGGVPTRALLSLGLPPSMPLTSLDGIVTGLKLEASAYRIEIVGGNISRTDQHVIIDLTLLGTVPRDEVVLRRGARPGDVLVVSGSLGLHAARRLAAEAAVTESPPDSAYPPAPFARVSVGRALAIHHLARAMLDISDGLASDAQHLARASQVGLQIDAASLPIAPETKSLAAQLGRNPIELALFGGEDYELLFAVRPDDAGKLSTLAFPCPLTPVGLVVPAEQGCTLKALDETISPLQPLGWTHF
jgi:thiamine-monophosphate kinase